MSDKDRPPNPFGRGDRTIIRPNPGGRLPQPPAAPSQPPDWRQPYPTPAPLAGQQQYPAPPPLGSAASSPLGPPAPQRRSRCLADRPVVQAPAPPAAAYPAATAGLRGGAHDARAGRLDFDTDADHPAPAPISQPHARHCGSTIWSRRTPIRSCARPGRCCCCSAGCASR